jgi:mono/diheme cytochrome c family protein
MQRFVWISMAVLGLSGVATAQAQAPAGQAATPAQPALVRGTEMAGANQFRAHCEVCHGTMASAPSIAILRKMSPERIYQALTTGAMRNQAMEAKLTDSELRDIATWMGGRKLEKHAG